ncbi:hypothetical protein AcW1_007944 [Taiwanofungus camphoratus]|nr:hypothetical protein AcW1_007944 [Antrodia cinnamomea]
MRGKRGKTLWLQKRTDTDTDTDTRRVLGYTHCCNGFIPSVLLFVIFRGILTGSAAFLVHSRTWHICLLANLSIAIFVFSSKNLLTRRSLPSRPSLLLSAFSACAFARACIAPFFDFTIVD